MMKNRNVFLVLICFLLTACGGNTVENDGITNLGEKYVEGKDCQNAYGNMPKIQKTENGYYFLIGEYLYFYEDTLKSAVPVCDKPDCIHNNKNCNAYLGDANEINYYDNTFFYIAVEDEMADNPAYYLYSISADGRQREKVVKLYTVEPGDNGFGCQLCVHRGYAFFSINNGANGLKRRKAVLQCYNLRSGGAIKNVAEMEGVGAHIFDIYAYGNEVYYLGSYADSGDGEFHDYTDCINICTGEVKKNCVEADYNVFYVDNVIHYLINNNKNGLCDVFAQKHHGQKQKITRTKVDPIVSYQNKHFFTLNWYECHKRNDYQNYKIDVYDKQFQKVTSVKMPVNGEWEYGDDKNLFVMEYGEGKRIIYQCDITHISQKTLKWKKILDERVEDSE